MNKKNIIKKDKNINLFQIIYFIWMDKFIILIITLIFIFLGIFYANTKTTQYTIYTKLIKTSEANLTNFTKLNYLSDLFMYDIKLNSERIFFDFIEEFNDKDELIEALQNDPKIIQNSLQNNLAEDMITLLDLSNNFLIQKNEKYGINSWEFVLIWDDIEHGIEIFDKAIILTLTNLKNSYLENIKLLKNNVKISEAHKLRRLKANLDNELNSQKKLLQEEISDLEFKIKSANTLNLNEEYEKNLPSDESELFEIFLGSKYLALKKSKIEEKLKMNDFSTENSQSIINEINFLQSSSYLPDIEQIISSYDQNNHLKWIKYDFSKSYVYKDKVKLIIYFLSLLTGLILSLLISFFRLLARIESEKTI